MKTLKSIGLLCLIYLLMSCNQTKKNENQSRTDELQGTWQSLDDDKSLLIFRNNQLIFSYDGEEQMEHAFTLADRCGKDTNQSDGDQEKEGYLIVDDMCYHIEELTSEHLTLFYIEGARFNNYQKITEK